MPWDPNNPGDFARLRDSIEASWGDLKPFRAHYREYWKEMAGTEYSHKSALKIVPVNLLELASTTYLDKLMGTPPRVNISTYQRRLRPAGKKLEQVVNNALKDYTVFSALRRATMAAMGTLAVVKVCVADAGYIDIEGYRIFKNRPYVKHIHIDDWVHDMSARAPGEWEFCGHRYEIELSEAQNREDFDPEARKALTAYDDKSRTPEGEDRGNKMQGDKQAKAPFKKTTSLWEIFLPTEQLVVTLGSTGDGKRPLKVQPWTGPEHGPYHWLIFKEVDGNTMPLTPSHLWMVLHRIVNALYRKLDRQASRQKTVTVIQSSDEKDGDKVNKASDGEAIALQNPAAAKELIYGGINQSNFAFMIQSKSIFSWLAGNLEMLGGLGPGSDTATQDKMMSANASQRITQMQQTVVLFVKRVLTDFSYYVWRDPIESYQVEIDIQGYGPVQSTLTPQEREHDFFEHQLEIDPYSMELKTPGQKMQWLMQLLQGFLLPIMPMLQQQGINVDFATLLKMFAEYGETPELEDILTQQGAPLNADTAAPPPPQQGQQGPTGQTSRQPAPPVTQHTSHRVSSPGKSNIQNADAALVQKLMGGNLQPAERQAA